MVSEKALKPYLFHGLDLQGQGEQRVADCPFCGREGKLSISAKTGLWRCFVCAAGNEKGGGNALVFLRLLWKLGQEMVADPADRRLAGLAQERGFLSDETLDDWGVCLSPVTKEWMIPAFNAKGELCQLYKWVGHPKRRLLPTPEMGGHSLFAPGPFSRLKDVEEIHVCEGPWDGMALWESLRIAKRGEDGGLVLTAANSASALGRKVGVVAVPGCGSIGEPFKRWLPVLEGKRVVLMFDSDHPKRVNGREVPPAGWDAARRAAALIGNPEGTSILRWGPEGFDPALPSGYDLRDFLKDGATPGQRVLALGRLLERITPCPEGWAKPRPAGEKGGGGEIDCLPCSSWHELYQAWWEAMDFHPGLERGLIGMLACIASTPFMGEQLWIKLIGPPSSGKTTICEAVSINRKYVFPKDTFTGLTSGFQVDKDGKENISMVEKLKNKTLVINDGDTVLQLPNRNQVLSQLRAFYGRNIRTQYGNKMSTDHEGINTTIILSGTERLRELDSSELGERFFDVVVLNEIDPEMERRIALRIAHRADRESAMISDGKLETRDVQEMARAKGLTGGYISYLRENAQRLLLEMTSPSEALERCVDLGIFVAYMRSRPSGKNEEKAQRELGYRLTSQIVRMAKYCALTLGKSALDAEVMKLVTHFSLDTARGRTLEIAQAIFQAGAKGEVLSSLAVLCREGEDKIRGLLNHMRKIGAVERRQQTKSGVRQPPRWYLTPRLTELLGKVMG